jgi:hypothetical protein
MAGLGPAIHVLPRHDKTWMPATSAGMTPNLCSAHIRIRFIPAYSPPRSQSRFRLPKPAKRVQTWSSTNRERVVSPLPSCHAVRCRAARVANAGAARAGALPFRMPAGRTPAQTGLAVSRGRERSRSLLVTPRSGGLRTRQADSSTAFGRQCGSRQQHGEYDAQDKTHDGPPFSLSTRESVFPMHRARAVPAGLGCGVLHR